MGGDPWGGLLRRDPLCATWTPVPGHACSRALPLVFGVWTQVFPASVRERMRTVDVPPHPTGPPELEGSERPYGTGATAPEGAGLVALGPRAPSRVWGWGAPQHPSLPV